MNKIGIIIKREYLSRVRNKTFIISTILTPVLIFGIIGLSTYFAASSSSSSTIAIQDESGFFKGQLKSSESLKFVYPEGIPDTLLKQKYDSLGYSGVLVIPAFNPMESPKNIGYYSTKQLGIINREKLKDKLNSVLQSYRLKQAGIDTARLNAAGQNLVNDILETQGGKNTNSAVSYGVGYASGFLMYILVFLFGSMIMRGVMEEKTNRVAEVVVSSVKPFELMMGKILGIAMVGLTGFLLWIVIVVVLNMGMAAFMGPQGLEQAQQMTNGMPGAGRQEGMMALQMLTEKLGSVNWGMIIFCFVFYFLGGYLFYAALFAAVGSAIDDDPQQAQSLMLPISMPIIISIVIMIKAITDPTSPMAVWASIIPFSSPIVMMARVPFGVPGTVPWWQLGLSMATLIAGFIFTTWLAARIYRTGILMYGKKASWKEMMKWAFRKQ